MSFANRNPQFRRKSAVSLSPARLPTTGKLFEFFPSCFRHLDSGATELHPASACSSQTRQSAFADDVPLKFRNCDQDVHLQSSGGIVAARVDTLPRNDQSNLIREHLTD